MTATLPTGHRTVSLTRTYRLYRFYDDAGQLLYLGMTGRMTLERLLEHVRTKPWAGDVACWERDPRTWSSEAECLAAERAAIIAERPLKNLAHNGNNPGATAVRRPPVRVPNRRPTLWARAWATRTGRRFSAWLHRAATVAAWWAVLTLALTVGLAVWGRFPLKDAASYAAVLVAALIGGALYLFRPRRGGRTNRRRTR